MIVLGSRANRLVDKFRALLVRFEQRDAYYLGEHHIASAMIDKPAGLTIRLDNL